jgi:membrane fusion protein (multidrug efflux system)
MFVKIRFVLDVKEDALLVPAEAVIPELSGYKVFVVDAEGKAAQRMIEIGTRTDTQVQVISGLNEGDLVLTTGVMQVRQGMPVTYTPIN